MVQSSQASSHLPSLFEAMVVCSSRLKLRNIRKSFEENVLINQIRRIVIVNVASTCETAQVKSCQYPVTTPPVHSLLAKLLTLGPHLQRFPLNMPQTLGAGYAEFA